MTKFASALNWSLMGLSGIAVIWRFIVMLRPFPIDSKSTLRGLLTAPLTMGVYALVLGASIINPIALYLLTGGAALGLLFGLFTRIRVDGDAVIGKRASFYLILWAVVMLATQWLGTAVGDGGVSTGLTLMLFPLGMGAVQDLIVLAKAGAARGRRPNAATAATILLAITILGAAFGANAAHAEVTWPGEDWSRAAAIEYNRGNAGLALDLVSKAEAYWGNIYSGDLKAYTQVIGYLASERLQNGQAATWLAKAKSTLSTQYSDTNVINNLITAMTRQVAAQGTGSYSLRNADVVFAQGLGAVYRQDIPELWARYRDIIERYRNYPGVAALLASLEPVLNAMATSEPVGEVPAAIAAASVPIIMLGSTVIDMRMLAELIKRGSGTAAGAASTATGGAAKSGATSASETAPDQTGTAGREAAAASQAAVEQLAKASTQLRDQLAGAVQAGADIPLSLTAWQPDNPAWLDLIRKAVAVYQENEDQVEAAQDIRELIEEATASDELAQMAASRLASAARFLQERGVSPADRIAVKIEDVAAKLGSRGVKEALAAVDAAGQDLSAAAQALFDSLGGGAVGG